MLNLEQTTSVTFAKEITVLTGATSEALYISGSARDSIKVNVIWTAGSGIIEQTISPIASIKADTANWIQVGAALTANTMVSIPTPITGLRFKATGATVKFEILAACL